MGATTDVETAGAIFGIGRSKAYQLAKAGEFPVQLLRIGRRYRVPVPSILELLGADL
ncbi:MULTISPECIES: helix-turn-helix domain-containing protein [Catenuloplanes]|uniref:helix-turn-helix domain-containing protein n=1 Tax=Catenuloplanes TaxID=33874 RepID=UPI00286B2E1B|nr:helix-turn-helix domain-containing protein [Catenuloplanes niger]